MLWPAKPTKNKSGPTEKTLIQAPMQVPTTPTKAVIRRPLKK